VVGAVVVAAVDVVGATANGGSRASAVFSSEIAPRRRAPVDATLYGESVPFEGWYE
jgi:hypothetical protein